MSDVRAFWSEQAKQHGSSAAATSPDLYYRELEINRIMQWICGRTVLDVGCGNGYSTRVFSKRFPDKKFLGIDYSEEMIEAAKSGGETENLKFMVCDVRKIGNLPLFDCIITERCLINLANWEEQQDAILKLRQHLPNSGRLILVENMIEGLDNLNSLREKVGLHPIQQRWHNQYICLEDLMNLIHKHFYVTTQENIGNLYYVISRVVYAKLAQMEGKEPDYNHPINEIASMLPSLSGYEFSPNYMIVCRKI